MIAFLSIAIIEIDADVTIKGAVVGEWTMDYESALALAKKEKLNILIKFTRAKCRNCIKMEKNILTTKTFIDYASKNLILIILDFSTKNSIVPEEYKFRNQLLAEKFRIRGYPECVYLESDGKTLIGKLGNRGDAPSFINKLKTLEIFTPNGIKKYLRTHPQKAEAFNSALDKIKKAEKELNDWIKTSPKKNKLNDKKHSQLIKSIKSNSEILMNIVKEK